MTRTATGSDTLDMRKTLVKKPGAYVTYAYTDMFSFDRAELEAFWLDAARLRFATLRPKLAMLNTLASKQDVTEIHTRDDLAALLFKASVYNSYPLSWIEKGDFTRMTKWLSKLTTLDLSSIDLGEVGLIEEWLAAVRTHSSAEICYSATTGGKMTFLARSKAEWDLYWQGGQWRLEPFGLERQHFKPLTPGIDKVPIFFPGPKGGARPFNITLAIYEKVFGDDLVIAPSPYMDADLMSLAGRIQEASKKGDSGLLTINPRLAARKGEIAQMKADGPRQYAAWMDRLLTEYRTKRIWVLGTMGSVHGLARKLLENGTIGAYAPDSLVSVGGGFPDGIEPDCWQDEVFKAFGIPPANMTIDFGMAEMMSVATRCSYRKYHLPPTTIPFVLDTVTDTVLPSEGSQTGRLAFYDLLAETYWGGFVTADKVTLNWDDCPCGRRGPHLDNEIGKIGDDGDKIGCAGSSQAHDEATEFLLEN